MAIAYAEIWAALAAPFEPEQLKERTQSGQRLTYVTAPTVANRLDDVLGPANWDFELSPWGDDALVGTLIVRLPDGTVVRKSNVGGCAGMKAGDDDAKSAASDCFKRCAVLLGVARYLYRDGVPRFVRDIVKGGGRKKQDAPPPDAAPAPIAGGAPGSAPEPAPAAEAADPRALLERGRFLAWLPAFIRKANAAFAESHPDVAGRVALIDRDMLLAYLYDWSTRLPDGAPADDLPRDMVPEALAVVFDLDPARMHAAARDFYVQRAKTAAGVKKGLKRAS